MGRKNKEALIRIRVASHCLTPSPSVLEDRDDVLENSLLLFAFCVLICDRSIAQQMAWCPPGKGRLCRKYARSASGSCWLRPSMGFSTFTQPQPSVVSTNLKGTAWEPRRHEDKDTILERSHKIQCPTLICANQRQQSVAVEANCGYFALNSHVHTHLVIVFGGEARLPEWRVGIQRIIDGRAGHQSSGHCARTRRQRREVHRDNRQGLTEQEATPGLNEEKLWEGQLCLGSDWTRDWKWELVKRAPQ